MAGLTDYWEGQYLNNVVSSQAFIGLSKTTPSDDGTGYTEPSGNGYLRVTTTAGVWGTPTLGSPSTKVNTSTITFPTATGDWSGGSNQTHWVMFRSSSATASSEVILFGSITSTKPVLSGDTASFAASSLTLQLGDPTDTY